MVFVKVRDSNGSLSIEGVIWLAGISLFLAPFGVWKLVEIALWLINHLRIVQVY